MSRNIPTVTDTAWAVNGNHRYDFGNPSVSHMCNFLSSGTCLLSSTTDFTSCSLRCYGYGFGKPSVYITVSQSSVVDLYPGMQKWKDDGQVDLWSYPRNCSDLALYQDKSCSYTHQYTPDFNPQGFSITLAGKLNDYRDGAVGCNPMRKPLNALSTHILSVSHRIIKCRL
jgi:hypothetical protein